MSRYEDIPSEVRAMLPSACDDGLTPEEAARIEDACNDDDGLRLLVDYLQLDADLSILMQGDEALARSLKTIGAHSSKARHSTSSAPMDARGSFLGPFDDTSHGVMGYFSSGWPVAYLVATVVFGLGLLVGAFVHVSAPVQVVRQPAPLPSALSPLHSFVGQITGMVDCQWADESTAAFNSAHVPLGRKYALASGLMEITYNTGAKVVLQGPCTYAVESPVGGFLSVGKLTARVEERGERTADHDSSLSTLHSPLFTINTPTATVTDLGTEFGVEVAELGSTYSHVYDGTVELQPVRCDGQRGQAVRLIENESARVEKGSDGAAVTVRDSETAPVTFVRVRQLSKIAEELRLKPFRRWQAYSEELRRDPSLVAYYDFQQKEGSPSVLPNVASNGDGSLDGVVENAIWTTGRMAGKHALRFCNPTDGVWMNLPQETDDLTLAAWVWVDSLDESLSGLLVGEGWNREGQVAWQVWSDGHVEFGVHGWREPYGHSKAIFDWAQLRRWTHFAVRYDHADASLEWYVDGQLFDRSAVPHHVPIRIGRSRIGQWESAELGLGIVRQFRGRMDELAIFGRPLASNEIRDMFEAGRPSEAVETVRQNRK